MERENLIVIAGPTATGKSALAVKIAKQFGGEIISADSRQIYKYLNIGTGKITRNEMRGVKHYCLGIADPKTSFTVVDYKRCAQQAIADIAAKRKYLKKKSAPELFNILETSDAKRAHAIGQHNKRRLIRAIEILNTTGGPIPKLKLARHFRVLMIGIKKTPKELRKAIQKTLTLRIKKGVLKEVKNLHFKHGISWQRLCNLGLDYKYISLYLKEQMEKKEALDKLEVELWRYAKRQTTWFKKEKRIKWIRSERETVSLVRGFLKN